MKKLTSIILLTLFFKASVSSQEYYKIENMPQIIRYYKNLKNNTESVSDSISIKISKKDKVFFLTLIDQNSKLLISCKYRFTNKYEDRVFVSRNTKEDGNELVKSKKKVKVLEPVSGNCIKTFLKL